MTGRYGWRRWYRDRKLTKSSWLLGWVHLEGWWVIHCGWCAFQYGQCPPIEHVTATIEFP